jgi:tRNA threonylcarbamoyladenosine biosynthesis protein TsaE
MNSDMIYRITTSGPNESIKLGERLGQLLRGGEVIELASDLGGGKTTLVKGIARGLGLSEEIVSPTFTISRVYKLPKGQELYHFDFYRLQPEDITAEELAEVVGQPDKIVAIEWARQVGTKLPNDRLLIKLTASRETERQIEITGSEKYQAIIEGLKK